MVSGKLENQFLIKSQLAERDVIDTIPKKLFEIDDAKAWKSVLTSVTSYALWIFMISKAPWYLLPLAWEWTGTAITGFFIIGHDCAHKSFSRNKLVEDIVGTLAFMPLIYPYEPWRFKHDRHHAKTNMLKEDTTWHPVMKEEFNSRPNFRKAIVVFQLLMILACLMQILQLDLGEHFAWKEVMNIRDEAATPIILVVLQSILHLSPPVLISFKRSVEHQRRAMRYVAAIGRKG